MADFYLVKKEDLDDLADGVRRVTNTSDALTVPEMADMMNNYTSSGGDISTCTVTINYHSYIPTVCAFTIYDESVQALTYWYTGYSGSGSNMPTSPFVVENVVCGSPIILDASYSLTENLSGGVTYHRAYNGFRAYIAPTTNGANATIELYSNV